MICWCSLEFGSAPVEVSPLPAAKACLSDTSGSSRFLMNSWGVWCDLFDHCSHCSLRELVSVVAGGCCESASSELAMPMASRTLHSHPRCHLRGSRGNQPLLQKKKGRLENEYEGMLLVSMDQTDWRTPTVLGSPLEAPGKKRSTLHGWAGSRSRSRTSARRSSAGFAASPKSSRRPHSSS